jgi:signal transduction histidine kinase
LFVKTDVDEEYRVRLNVKNVGVGLRPEAGSQLFEAFYTTKKRGMGIGLSVSRSIIEAHRGHLWAVSKYRMTDQELRFRFLSLAGRNLAQTAESLQGLRIRQRTQTDTTSKEEPTYRSTPLARAGCREVLLCDL